MGSFGDHSCLVNSYHAEQLGMLIFHTMLAALALYYKIKITYAKLCCDNSGALHKALEHKFRIMSRSTNADIGHAQ